MKTPDERALEQALYINVKRLGRIQRLHPYRSAARTACRSDIREKLVADKNRPDRIDPRQAAGPQNATG